jgi:NAD-dependent dihydropyrimidine dehydrogenase PreA subunit
LYDKIQFSIFSKRNPVSFVCVPIDRTFRKKWRVFKEHQGHPVWHSLENEGAEIHGQIVGVDFSLCFGCEKCIDACPTNVFDLIEYKPGELLADPIREDDCILCLVCEIVCPVEAISIIREGGSEDTLDSLLEGKRG